VGEIGEPKRELWIPLPFAPPAHTFDPLGKEDIGATIIPSAAAVTSAQAGRPDDGSVVGLIERYLDDRAHEKVRSWVLGSEPLVQRVELDIEAWRKRFSEIQPPLSPGPTLDGLDAALSEINRNAGMSRSDLERFSMNMTSPADAARLWVATMCWGSKNPRLWRLTQWVNSVKDGLADQLYRMLTQSQPESGVGEQETFGGLTAMYWASRRLDGVGESYGTKWLWALGLDSGRDFPFHLLVLDRRVHDCLKLLGWRPSGESADRRYVDFCKAASRWADMLNIRIADANCDPYRIEQLLFDRPTRRKTDPPKPPSLYEWLDP
jgi:hypothetical protein